MGPIKKRHTRLCIVEIVFKPDESHKRLERTYSEHRDDFFGSIRQRRAYWRQYEQGTASLLEFSMRNVSARRSLTFKCLAEGMIKEGSLRKGDSSIFQGTLLASGTTLGRKGDSVTTYVTLER
jgi:hypothetical protein